MKELVSKSKGFTRIEFWALSTIAVFILFGYITNGLDGPGAMDRTPFKSRFTDAGVPFNFYYHYFTPQLIRNVCLIGTFLYLNFLLVPELISGESVKKNVFLLIGIFFVFALVFGITGTYLRGFLYGAGRGRDAVDQEIFRDNFLFALGAFGVFAIYTVIKYCAIYLVTHASEIYARHRFFTVEGIVAFAVWLIILFLLIMLQADAEIVVGWLVIVFSAIILYLFSFYRLIPLSMARKKYSFASYVLKCVLLIAIASLPFILIFTAIFDNDERGVEFGFLNSFFQLCLTVPITWTVYKRKMKGNEEIIFLTKELRQSTAEMDFLRSQINPHFLFNALNTLYGTALQEKADRTGEGIQMLGDMMRFMLQENLQNKISLSREIDYLENYITLQKLRTDHAPDIEIKTAIHDRENMYQIAPMLLIPFVENAFKHGISFREPSHIKLTLEIKDHTLFFDVYNSKHPRNENDPEKDRSGVGLENVKQRLKLMYPGRHELLIRETSKEFFIHLTIKMM